MKKHGCLWWVCIGWWWVPITLPFRLLAVLIRYGRKYAAGTEERVQRIQAWGAAQEAKQAEKKAERINRANKKMRGMLGVQDPQQQEPQLWEDVAESFKVAGISHRPEAIEALGKKNPKFTMSEQELLESGLTETTIWEYSFSPRKQRNVELISEPDNSKDDNAIKVIVDGQHIGYIEAESCAHVNKLLKEDRIQHIKCSIGGGRKKSFTKYGAQYILESDFCAYSARLTVTKKPKD